MSRRVSSRSTKSVAPSRLIEKDEERPKKARLVRSPTPEFAAVRPIKPRLVRRPIKPRLVRRPIKQRLVRSSTPEFTAVRPIKPRLVRSPTPEVAAVRSPTPEFTDVPERNAELAEEAPAIPEHEQEEQEEEAAEHGEEEQEEPAPPPETDDEKKELIKRLYTDLSFPAAYSGMLITF
jgi:hypothetical protein